MLAYVLCYIYIITFVLFGTEAQLTVLVVDVDAKQDVQVFWFIFSDEVFTDVTYTVSICNCVYNYILQLEIHNGCWVIVSLRVHTVSQKCGQMLKHVKQHATTLIQIDMPELASSESGTVHGMIVGRVSLFIKSK